jgi:kynurenine formamidase
MPAIVDPVSGLKFYELSHRWGYNSPTFPGYEDVKLERITYHAKHGVMTQKITAIMHVSTHVNAPIHLVPGAKGVGDIAMDRFFGSGVVLGIAKKKWELIAPADLEKAAPAIEAQDIVVINTQWHHRYADSQEYFGHAPGLSKAAAEWLIAKKVKLVGVDMATVDHPLATSLGPHRNGPQIKDLPKQYKDATGHDAKQDFPEWNAAHKALLAAGIPTIENVGGDLDEVTGKRATFHAYPWFWREGDACVIRLVAMFDSTGDYRLESGERVVR